MVSIVEYGTSIEKVAGSEYWLVTDFPDFGDEINSIMTVIDKATRMTHLIYCNKSISTTETLTLYIRYIVKLHGVLGAIYSNRGTQLVSKF